MKPSSIFWITCCAILLSMTKKSKTAVSGGFIPGISDVHMLSSHVVLGGDFVVEIISSSFSPLVLELSHLEGESTKILTSLNVYPEARALSLNKTTVKVACGYFIKGGQYYVTLKPQPPRRMGNGTVKNVINSKEVPTVIKPLDVRWPTPQLKITPEYVQTYPQKPVRAIIEFPEVKCSPVQEEVNFVPEFWLELYYCGHSLIECGEKTLGDNKTQAIYREQVRGFSEHHMLVLRCELFGVAGHYVFTLRPSQLTPSFPMISAYLQADWSDQFVFNVHARSIIPCDSHSTGIRVLFEYPSCILEKGDRIRLFGRLRANVTSINPPTSLVYIAEQWIKRGEHRLDFNCDLFTEKYVEYCFVYVSQAITGAVSNVREDCVPTFPVSESESGGWGPWTPWTQCTSTCIGGVRTRYRFCNSPPPRYGAKFCEGPAVQTEKCYIDSEEAVECWYGDIKSEIPNIPQIREEVGTHCRCGCFVHLGKAKSQRFLEASSQSCPGKNFWQIQADENCIIELRIKHVRLLCDSQYLKIRDGTALSSNLIAYFTDTTSSSPPVVNSSGSNLLLEFYTSARVAREPTCNGRFLVQAVQLASLSDNKRTDVAQHVGFLAVRVLKLTAVHIAAIFLLSGLLFATFLLGIQYMIRYRKYQIAKSDDQDSLTDPSGSATNFAAGTRVPSSNTLISEVISLTKLRTNITSRNKHIRLRESMDCETFHETEVTLAKGEDSLSDSSTLTLAQEETTTTGLPQTSTVSEMEEATVSLPVSPNLEDSKVLTRSSTMTIKSSSEKDNTKEKEEKPTTRLDKAKVLRRLSNVSANGLTKVSVLAKTLSKSDPGCYSPALSNTSRAKIRHTNEKESKEKQNREKLLAGPLGSEFSIAGQETDLELDYYDYNVTNAGAAPGSYLGMDPAFLVWIPPLDESGEILKELEETTAKNKIFVDPGSNQESPDEITATLRRRSNLNVMAPVHTTTIKNGKHVDSNILSECNPKLNDKQKRIKRHSISKEAPQFIELSNLKKSRRTSSGDVSSVLEEKETKLEKFVNSDSNILNEIKYADDD
ncbi:uncharacterized protein LOC108741789 isoform X2 [Agrilus planipennis]|uniref:Uncharacterized protein LOC108741789 isoform X2 n=1 Tax=Agrilus planipennis TaxID=224129 RepID=A0A1W4X855_AGRPL|nr:uncharacterized protein LOC108741789 isoform X2 [Agrilus planipennis]